MQVRPLRKVNYEEAASLYAETLAWQFFSIPPCDPALFVDVFPMPSVCFYEIVSSDTERFLGFGGLEKIRLLDRTADPVIALVATERGTGLGKRFAKRLFDTVPKALGIHRVHSIVLQGSPSIPLLDHLGFKKEGTLERVRYKDGKYLDADVYARLFKEV